MPRQLSKFPREGGICLNVESSPQLGWALLDSYGTSGVLVICLQFKLGSLSSFKTLQYHRTYLGEWKKSVSANCWDSLTKYCTATFDGLPLMPSRVKATMLLALQATEIKISVITTRAQTQPSHLNLNHTCVTTL